MTGEVISPKASTLQSAAFKAMAGEARALARLMRLQADLSELHAAANMALAKIVLKEVGPKHPLMVRYQRLERKIERAEKRVEAAATASLEAEERSRELGARAEAVLDAAPPNGAPAGRLH